MTTIDDLGVTKGKVRAYGHDGAIEKLSVEQLRAVCCDYLILKWRTKDTWRRWPKDVQRELRARGITQSHTSGLPIVSALGSKMSVRMINEEKSELVRLSEALEKAEAELVKGLSVGINGFDMGTGDVSHVVTVKDGEIIDSVRCDKTPEAKLMNELSVEDNSVSSRTITGGEVAAIPPRPKKAPPKPKVVS